MFPPPHGMPPDSSRAEILLALSSQKAFLEDPLIRPIAEDRPESQEWRDLVSIWEKRCLSGAVDEQLFADFHLDFLAWSAELWEQAIILRIKTLETIETIMREEAAAGHPLPIEASLIEELTCWSHGNSRESMLAQLPIETRRELENGPVWLDGEDD